MGRRLTKEEQEKIDHIIDDVYIATGMSYPNDGLISMVTKYGINILDWDFQKEGAPNVFAAIKYPEGTIDKPIILINKRKSDTKKTFALAHEFGHYLLHEHNGTKLWLDYDFSEDSEDMDKERAANYFAAALLMPKTEFLRQIELLRDLNAVATYFGVSRSAVDVRLRWINGN